MKRAVFLGLALALAACGRERLRLAPGEEGEVIEAEGWGAMSGDLLDAKRRALADAQRKAVERAAGVFIAGRTRVDMAVAVDERILSKVDGYIRKYDVLSERQDGGFLKMRIKALVLYHKLGEDVKALGLSKPPPPPGNPRVAVVVTGADPASAQAGLRTVLLAKGFQVVDADAAKSDVLLQTQAQVHPVVDARLGSMQSARARLTVQAVKPKSGELLAVKNQEASGLDLTPEVAASKALEKAGELAGEAVAAELAPLLKSQVIVAVRVRGLESFEKAHMLVDDIRMNPEVRSATLSDYEQGVADLQVATDGLPGDELSSLITRSRRFTLTATSVSAYAVELAAR